MRRINRFLVNDLSFFHHRIPVFPILKHTAVSLGIQHFKENSGSSWGKWANQNAGSETVNNKLPDFILRMKTHGPMKVRWKNVWFEIFGLFHNHSRNGLWIYARNYWYPPATYRIWMEFLFLLILLGCFHRFHKAATDATQDSSETQRLKKKRFWSLIVSAFIFNAKALDKL